jgi:hypothetical protein
MSETSGMKRIILEAVPQSAMRAPYDQDREGGDWFLNPEGDLVIRVIGDDLDKPEAFLFALHELIEAKLCLSRGISQEVVDRFDAGIAASLDEGEPGDHPASPYRREHRFACLIEFLMAHELGVVGYGTVL